MGRGDSRRQILAFHKFHHQERPDLTFPTVLTVLTHPTHPTFFESVDRCDVRMIQRGEGLRFALEAGAAISVVRERLGQDLDRDVAIQLRVARTKHLPHTAFADLRSDLVGAESGAGCKGQWFA